MLKNYFKVKEDEKINNFLKSVKEKKNSHYIILDSTPESFVDIRIIALKASNINEKLKGLKKPLTTTQETNPSKLVNLLIDSGDRVIQYNNDYFDFLNALEEILNQEADFLKKAIKDIEKKEIYALNQEDKLSNARNLFLNKRINLLPVIKGLNVIGEVRPIDFLITDLYDQNSTGNLPNKKHSKSILNLDIENIVNTRPITISKDKKIKELIELMIKKHLPSVIIVDEEEKLYSVISYKDIFRLYKKSNEKEKYTIEYQGASILYPEDFDLIQDFAIKSMNKIIKMSNYDSLKLTFKTIGEKDSGHLNKIEIKALISHANNVINVQKEISPGTSDEIYNDKKKERWNIPQIAQDVLNILEKKIKQKKIKKK
ncbi:MAG: HPP family protein [Nanoarchaeota archaeon]